jgi:hypothetical protein
MNCRGRCERESIGTRRACYEKSAAGKIDSLVRASMFMVNVHSPSSTEYIMADYPCNSFIARLDIVTDRQLCREYVRLR